MWNIGNIIIENRIVLAPMAGISNTSFRRIIKEMGAGLIFAEMVSDKAICYNNEKTIQLLKMDECERPIVQQIFGNDIDSFVEAAKKIEDVMHPDIIDINMGCPVPKIALRSQAGSALLKNPRMVYEIVKAVVESVSVPITVKIRSGWDNNSINAIEVAKAVEKAGASAITVHGRTRSQGYSGKSDWNIIKKVKENISIPVIGNGDVTNPELAKKMLDETKCDAVMIGRGVLGNPWLIKNCIDYLKLGKYNENVTITEKIQMIKRHFNLLVNDKCEKLALLEIRSHAMWYLKGVPGNALLKQKICNCKSKDDLFYLLENVGE